MIYLYIYISNLIIGQYKQLTEAMFHQSENNKFDIAHFCSALYNL